MTWEQKIEEIRQESFEKGKLEKATEIVVNMYKNDFPEEDIAKAVKMSIEQVHNILRAYSTSEELLRPHIDKN